MVPVILGQYYGFGYLPPRPFFIFFFPFGFLIFLVVVFFAFRLLFWGWGWNRGFYRGRWRYADSLEIVKWRYARGEIGREEYEQIVRDLESHPSSAS